MIASLTVVLLCQLIGEVIVQGLSLPLPGPVLGLLLLLITLLARDRFVMMARGPFRDNSVENVSKGLLTHLSLLFVPAGVGVVQKLDLLAAHGIGIICILMVSVTVTLLATVLTFQIVSRFTSREDAR
ncbi:MULTISPECIES: CidA/LrgA family protein [unclassified Bradyrhizobium]|uniref:CidA/LrgA family protein n=1 Tax=unclassified Bradyrhizobium TaxID=2631580 RepID=UPI001CD4503A|nr:MULTISPECIES: CidA/LrgA family protein [unclassified Bradyrhizobium]MCA1378763.1 CidA/LrgA family protein [Bradyrhizobium sp. IC4060]MCA1487787.1 CidA/LrgA family protein [Bradyrhizobium sp. IC4061]